MSVKNYELEELRGRFYNALTCLEEQHKDYDLKSCLYFLAGYFENEPIIPDLFDYLSKRPFGLFTSSF